MDAPLPDDFDPYGLAEKPMNSPRKRDDEGHQEQRAPQNQSDSDETPFPLLHVLPSPLRKLLFTGSCCAGVAVLYFLSAWDHGLMPGFDSSFAKASEVQNLKSDLADLYVLSLARAIRDLSADNCPVHSLAITEQIDVLQSKYKARTGDYYRHVECKQL